VQGTTISCSWLPAMNKKAQRVRIANAWVAVSTAAITNRPSKRTHHSDDSSAQFEETTFVLKPNTVMSGRSQKGFLLEFWRSDIRLLCVLALRFARCQ